MKDYLQDDIGDISISTARSARELAQTGDPMTWALLSPANANHPIATNTAPDLAAVPGAKSLYRTWGKRLLDIAFVIATLPISVPVILICALALWIEGGSPFYRQDRLGKGGARFSILKLRTMVPDADAKLARYLADDPEMRAAWETTQKLKNDPRVTRVGGLLRTTSLDELPQLWNVLKGEMSLVGPRPMMPQQLPLYGEAQAYFATLPGITGIWQVSGRNETHFSFRAGLDVQYFRELSLKTDLGLLLKTVGVVLRRTGY